MRSSSRLAGFRYLAHLTYSPFRIRFIEVDEEKVVDLDDGRLERFSGALTGKFLQ